MQEEEEFKKTLLSDKVSDVKTEIEEHFDQIIVKITNLKEETIRNFEEEKQNATNAIDKTILEIKENTRKFEDRKDEIRNILAREDEDLQNSMCMKLKKRSLLLTECLMRLKISVQVVWRTALCSRFSESHQLFMNLFSIIGMCNMV